MNSLNICLNIFKCLCILATAFMVGYWLFKFEKNSDTTLIEYKSVDDVPDFVYPELTICFINPFLKNQSVNITNSYSFLHNYHLYLKGRNTMKRYSALEYEDVSVDLAKYFKMINFGWKIGLC